MIKLHQSLLSIYLLSPFYLADQVYPSTECKVYLAESSIPNAGLGIYTAVDVVKDGVLTDNDIPIIDTDFRSHNDYVKFPWLLDQYYWGKNTFSKFYEAESLSVALPSFGMAANCHFFLHNTNMKENNEDDVPRLHRSIEPGSGAVTDSKTISWVAVRNISKGEEIFLWYGEDYFTSRARYSDVPLYNTYTKADNITCRMAELFRNNSDTKPEAKKQLWDIIKEVADPRLVTALPDYSDSLDSACDVGTARHALPKSIRSVEWLRENGQCMENLKVGPSTISQAGRGAFASRFIAKGDLVAPAPLVQILDRKQLNKYEVTQTDDGYKATGTLVIGQQLLMNYCFGHKDSSLLLFPYSSAVQFINHNSKNYNAEIKWSESSYHHTEWLDLPIENMTAMQSGLMFDIIATRDIQPDEEVFIDYGKEWENAWNEHVEEWEPADGADEFIHPDVMNNDTESRIRDIGEQEYDPYPDNLQTACYYWRDLDKIEIKNVDGQAKVEVKWYYDDEDFDDAYLRPCDIIERYTYKEDSNSQVLYSANVKNHGHHIGNDEIPSDEEHVVYDIPRNAIRFVSTWYTSDLFLENAFRHHIGVPEGLFPDIWMNRRDISNASETEVDNENCSDNDNCLA